MHIPALIMHTDRSLFRKLSLSSLYNNCNELNLFPIANPLWSPALLTKVIQLKPCLQLPLVFRKAYFAYVVASGDLKYHSMLLHKCALEIGKAPRLCHSLSQIKIPMLNDFYECSLEIRKANFASVISQTLKDENIWSSEHTLSKFILLIEQNQTWLNCA